MKSFLEQVKQSIESGSDLSRGLSQPYPIEVTAEMTDCFATSFEIISEVITDLNSSSIAEIAEALWVYSKYASVSAETDDNTYLKSMLFNVRDEIEAKLDIIEDKTKRDEMREICNNVFSGENFGDEEFNTILERIIVQ